MGRRRFSGLPKDIVGYLFRWRRCRLLPKSDGSGFSQVRSEGGGLRGVSSETQKCGMRSPRGDLHENAGLRDVRTFGTPPRTRLESTEAEKGDVEVAIVVFKIALQIQLYQPQSLRDFL